MATQGMKKTAAASTQAKTVLEAEATGADEIQVDLHGETLTLDPDVFDDYEIMSLVTKGVPFPMLEAAVPDSEQLARLLDHYPKNKAGRVSMVAGMELATEIMQAVRAGK